MKIEQGTRKTTTAFFSDHFDKEQFCEVCEWENGEGADIMFDKKIIQLTHAEITAFFAAYNASQYNYEGKS